MGADPVGTSISGPELGAYFALRAAGDLMTQRVSRQLREHDLSEVQFSVLARLADAPSGVRMGELAGSLVVSRSGLTYQVSRLEEAGLVGRDGSAGDERGVVAHLTGAGAERLAAAMPGHVALVRTSFLDHVAPADLEVVERVLREVAERLDPARAATTGGERAPG